MQYYYAFEFNTALTTMLWDSFHSHRLDFYSAQNLWHAPDFSGAHIMRFKFTSFQSNRQNNEKVLVNSKYYHEH